MSFFQGRQFAGYAPAQQQPPNPADEVQRLLNSYASTFALTERDIQQMRDKHAKTVQAYQAASKESMAAKDELRIQRHALAEVEARCSYVRQQVAAKQEVGSKARQAIDRLTREKQQLKEEYTKSREEMVGRCRELLEKLRELKAANASSFFTSHTEA